ncbi:uncharacterized protein LOC127285380 [Leptopilina boulardi]|uniref:uncharacterized protein LOC127285380 n=1 Tax=Leptopilina boulardi TaxID=63433 RepID=UPI0021F634C7|nr:uncharacterized protein LOC127285380 [Leptopilina boulardi]
MSLVISKENSSQGGYFLPHHAVIKGDSLTTKTRVVFDGSAKTTSGISLNDALMVGPTIQQDLFSIVIRFRTFQFVFTADIKQMYRQISVSPEDACFQKIVWRNDPKEEIQTYKLNTVTFGTACALFLASRTLHQLANDEQESHPIASSILKEDFFVDDCLSGSNDIQEALYMRNDLINLLKKGNFVLRKWSSNCPKLLEGFPSEVSNSHLCLDPTETVKTLGLHWNPVTDSFGYSIKLTNSKLRCSKCFILSETAKLFDPLGILEPITVTAKLIIQQLWKAKLFWDDPVPELLTCINKLIAFDRNTFEEQPSSEKVVD